MQQQSKAPVNAAIPGSNMVRSLADAVQDVVSDGQSMFGSNMQSAPSCEFGGKEGKACMVYCVVGFAMRTRSSVLSRCQLHALLHVCSKSSKCEFHLCINVH